MRKNNFICFLAGSLMNFALAPFFFFPVLFVSFPVLYLKLKNASPRQGFLHGWWFGFGYFLFGLYWISNSLLVDLSFAWLIPFAISLIPAAAAIYTGLAAYVYKKIKINSPVLLAVFWVVAEYLKGMFPFGGFPWNDIGYSALFLIYFAQIASIGGIYFTGFVVIIIALCPVFIIATWPKPSRYSISALLMGITLAFTCFAYGYIKVQPTKFSNLKVAIIQPNIAQTLKWDPALMQKNFFDTMALAANADADITILPEASVPYQISREPEVQKMLGQAAPKNGFIIAGSTRSDGQDKIYNSLYLLDSDANIISYYDKHHLVPFGEYVPFRSVLPIDKITPGMMDFSSGAKGKTLSVKGKNFLPLICYEIIFPEYAKGDYDFIVNTTNDAWFGNSTGPQQHLAMARMRAIEQGRPVLRAANTGVSAIIDPEGRIIKKLTYDAKGRLESSIPEKLAISTCYAKYGSFLFQLLVVCVIIIVTITRKNVKKL